MIAPNSTLLANRSDRVRQIVGGVDRAKFLHNYCTNDVKRLSKGRGCEAFVTSIQGRTLAWISIHERGDDLILRADPGGLELANPHFAKYALFDDVSFRDSSEETREFHVAGSQTDAIIAQHFGPEALPGPEALSVVSIGDLTFIRESPLFHPGITVIGALAFDPTALIREIGGVLSASEIEGLRIQAGTPRFKMDISPENLPQEIDRDVRAISFVKGCYLGQETVARLDALGHVNRMLRRVIDIEGEAPDHGVTLTVDGSEVGVVTSAGKSPVDGESHAIAMIRVKPAPPGTLVRWRAGQGRIAELTTVDAAGEMTKRSV